jgi:hypothetical protein
MELWNLLATSFYGCIPLFLKIHSSYAHASIESKTDFTEPDLAR